jgi:hypothetical protein
MPSSSLATVDFGGDLIAVNTDLDSEAGDCPRPMRLEGTEALELYLVEIGRNLALLGEQVALLRAALVERRRLLCMIAASRRDAEERPRPMH